MTASVYKPEWRNGRRGGLKIRSWRQGKGSSPFSGTKNDSGQTSGPARFFADACAYAAQPRQPATISRVRSSRRPS